MSRSGNVGHYDIVIIGSGMVGATLACALAETSLSVAIVDALAQPPSWPEDAPVDLRVSAITPAAERVFRRLGAWPGMAQRGVSPFREMFVWDALGGGDIHFDSADHAAPYLGHIIENRVVQAALVDCLLAAGQVELISPVCVQALTFNDDSRARITLDDGVVLHGRLVVAADGGRSRIRQLTGIGVRGWSYGQRAIVAVVETSLSHQETAWQCFHPQGPLAFLPLRDGRCSIVWTTTPEEAERLLNMEAELFCHYLAEAAEGRLGEIVAVGERASFPLQLQQASHYVEEGLALIGDAAHTIHPLAGQGANLGIIDAAVLAEVIISACADGCDWASREQLRRYERWRQGDVLRMMAMMEGFKRLFADVPAPIAWLRSAGLDFGNRCQPVKRALVAHQLGQSTDLPPLAVRAADLMI